MSYSELMAKEELLAALLEAALDDVEQLTCTKERAGEFMTAEAVERNAALFEAKPVVGLQEFMDAQSTTGGKYAAFIATVGDPSLVATATLSALPGDSVDELSDFVGHLALATLMEGSSHACTALAIAMCIRLGKIRGGVENADNIAAADAFFRECLSKAAAWALSTAPGERIAGDATPGVTH